MRPRSRLTINWAYFGPPVQITLYRKLPADWLGHHRALAELTLGFIYTGVKGRIRASIMSSTFSRFNIESRIDCTVEPLSL
jgi:hypothetical protein